jgi:RluA family pseudouridine synthase
MAVAGENGVGGTGEVPVLFENDDVLVVSKPPGLASISERDRSRDSLHHLLESTTRTKLFVVHRIDKDASGVIVFAKNPAAHKSLNEQFSHREVDKRYLALVHGILGASPGRIDAAIRAFGSGRMGIDERGGKPSSTSYEVVRTFERYTLIRVRTASGRRHQIRVHLYSLGHAIVGDRTYGDRDTQARYPRLMLHAQSVSFRLPSGETTTVECPIAESFSSVLSALAGPEQGKEVEG